MKVQQFVPLLQAGQRPDVIRQGLGQTTRGEVADLQQLRICGRRLLPAGPGDLVHRPPRVGQPEGEQKALHPLSVEIDPDLSEVDLGIGGGR
ncbi:hypothetical protein [Streptomyces sp. H23]|uniref:hypothetical protein n=1 Tax=Streptomyces sp. H23 TaxID=2541723 RepID=UPI00106DD3C8|nr:hypothetical protein [Streptomyces sp. H23]